MLAQGISLAAQESAHLPLITLARRRWPNSRASAGWYWDRWGRIALVAAIDTDIPGKQAHSGALDADSKGPLCDIP
jgi:hypothetical protein